MMCMYDSGDYAAPEFASGTYPVALKQHRCCECSRKIEPGEVYERVHTKADGEFFMTKTCTHCCAARRWLVHECGGWVTSMVREDLTTHWYDEPDARSFWLGRAVVGMRRGWKRRDGETLLPPLEEPKTAAWSS